jgi:hypothetical protein
LLGTRALVKGPSEKKGFEPAQIPYSKQEAAEHRS